MSPLALDTSPAVWDHSEAPGRKKAIFTVHTRSFKWGKSFDSHPVPSAQVGDNVRANTPCG